LAGAWKASPGALEISPEELAEITPFLLKSAAGGLGWWRIRHTNLVNLSAGQELHNAYRLHTLQAAMHEEALRQALEYLHACGIEPILIKGWATSRLYPELGLRPHGDIDLALPTEQRATVLPLLGQLASLSSSVDVHFGMPDLPDRTEPLLWQRSRLIPVSKTCVRILSPEDQIRLLCLHMFRHGAWRPLWLCDVAVALEAVESDFDWHYCLRGDPRLSEWVLAGIGLATLLLRVRLPRADVRVKAEALASSLAGTVLEQWGLGRCGDSHSRDTLHFADYGLRPDRWWPAAWRRWPNPIEAAMYFHSRPGSLIPNWFFQAAAFSLRAGRMIVRLRGEPCREFSWPGVTIHEHPFRLPSLDARLSTGRVTRAGARELLAH
jgi:hypothetical protein